VQSLKKEGNSWCRYDQLIEDTMVILNILQFWSVIYVKRVTNGVAHDHRLVKEMLFLINEQVLMEEAPHCIHDVVTVERRILDFFTFMK
jgi:hypothetical protein